MASRSSSAFFFACFKLRAYLFFLALEFGLGLHQMLGHVAHHPLEPLLDGLWELYSMMLVLLGTVYFRLRFVGIGLNLILTLCWPLLKILLGFSSNILPLVGSGLFRTEVALASAYIGE